VHAQAQPQDGMLSGLESSFALPLHDLLVKKHASEWRNLIDGFGGDVLAYFPFAAPESGRDASGHLRAVSLSDGYVAASVKYTPISHWFASIQVNKYLSKGAQQPWNPDFTYVVGYDDWHPYTLSLVYANYSGNRFSPRERLDGTRTDVQEGSVTLGWKLKVPKPIDEAMAVHSTGGTALQVHYSLTPDYTTASGTRGHSKQKLGATVKYSIYKWWYVQATPYYYLRVSSQQPWDPDYTWGFGYYDWHPGSFSIQYNTYAGNRFPWHHSRGPGAHVRDGAATISWSWSTTR
jgi:hypothetical protein